MTGATTRTGGIVIGIPTFRRPERLRRLLASLEPSLIGHENARIVVGDNGCDDVTREVVETFAERWPRTVYVAVGTRGISANRNALIAHFLADPSAAWLGMLDDDLAVGGDWLKEMLAIGIATRADVVGAPYAFTGSTNNFVVRNSLFVRRLRQPSGVCAPVHASGNILLARNLFDICPGLRFDDRFGLSGGEDYDFFSRAADGGARFAWCDEAFGDEHLDEERLNTRAVAFRYYTSGLYMGVSDSRRRGGAFVLGSRTKLLAQGFGLIAVGAASLDPARALRGVFFALLATGGLASLVGLRAYRYR